MTPVVDLLFDPADAGVIVNALRSDAYSFEAMGEHREAAERRRIADRVERRRIMVTRKPNGALA